MRRLLFSMLVTCAAAGVAGAADAPVATKSTGGFDIGALDRVGRPVRRLLRVRLRWVAQGQPDPGRPDALGPLQRAGRAQPRGAARDPREGEGAPGLALQDRGEGGRLLRRVHGRAGHRGEGPRAARSPLLDARGRGRLEAGPSSGCSGSTRPRACRRSSASARRPTCTTRRRPSRASARAAWGCPTATTT